MKQGLKIGIMHPGEMGISIAASIKNTGHDVYWCSAGRSIASQARARQHDLIGLETLDELVNRCQLIISICPPDAAESVADEVIKTGFNGLYLDANAISPQRAIAIAQQVEAAGMNFIDGGVVGPPAWEPGSTWMHLSGEKAQDLVEIFQAGPIQTTIVGDKVGMASALKICFAAYTKGRTALLLDILALAEHHQIRGQLTQQWDDFWDDFVSKTNTTVNNALPKAWRFSGEMAEIADAFQAAGLPDGIHRSAETIFSSLAEYKDMENPPDMDEILRRILRT